MAAALAGLAVASSVPLWVAVAAVAVLACIAVVAHRLGEHACVDAAVAAGVLWLLLRLPGVGVWPIPAGLAVVGAGMLAWRQRRLRAWRGWLRAGRVTAGSWMLVGGVVAVTIPALLLWRHVADGRLPAAYSGLVHSVPWPVAVLLVLAFLILNGAIEDTLWSGLLLTATSRGMPAVVAVVLTAASFAVAHLHGIPGGTLGVGMVFLWGIALTVLRLRTGGMLATYLAHVAADATIVVMLGVLSVLGPNAV